MWHLFNFLLTTLYHVDNQSLACNEVVVATTKVRIFKQITTHRTGRFQGCKVVVATTKVRIFKQITTIDKWFRRLGMLLLLPQRYVFSSKSQLMWLRGINVSSCCCYHKGTYFQANHNRFALQEILSVVVVATTKVRIFKQITTIMM